MSWGHFAWRLALSLSLAVAALVQQGPDLGRWLAPLFAQQVQAMDDHYQVQSLVLTQQGGEQVFRLEVSQARCIVLRDRAHCPHPLGRAHTTTLLGHVTLPTALMLAVGLAWPVRWRGRGSATEWALATAVRLPCLALAIALIWAIDVPLVLWANIWRFHVDAFAPGLFSPLLLWADFLQSGGRLAAAMALVVPCAMATMRAPLSARAPTSVPGA